MSELSRVYLRCDADNTIGKGHLTRMMALATTLSGEFDFIFIIKKTTNAEELLDQYNFLYLPEFSNFRDEIDWIVSTIDYKELLVSDGYQFDTEYQALLRHKGIKHIYIDDLAKFQYSANAIINHAPGVSPNKYDCVSPCELALGTKFSLLREEFKRNRRTLKLPTKGNVFISFGGTNLSHLYREAIISLQEMPLVKKITVLVGSSTQCSEISDIANDITKISYGLKANEVAQLMCDAEIFIVSASTIMLEALSIGGIVIAGKHADNQGFMYDGALHENMIYGIGDLHSFDFKNKLADVFSAVSNKENSSELIQAQSKAFQINSKNNLLALLKATKLELAFIEASFEHSDTLLSWRNDPITVKNSINAKPVLKEEHEAWLSRVIASNETRLYVVSSNIGLIGTVRLDKDNEETEVSWTIAPEQRGKGLGKIVVNRIINKIEGKSFARVKINNPASIKIAEFAGLNRTKVEGDIVYLG